MSILIFGNDYEHTKAFVANFKSAFGGNVITFGQMPENDYRYQDIEDMRVKYSITNKRLPDRQHFIDFWHSCDRNAVNGVRFKLVEALYRQYVGAWQELLNNHRINLIIFMTIPHTQWCTSLLATASANDIKSVSFFPTLKPNYKIFVDTITSKSLSYVSRLDLPNNKFEELSERVTSRSYDYMKIQRTNFRRKIKKYTLLLLPNFILGILVHLYGIFFQKGLISYEEIAFNFTELEMVKQTPTSFISNVRAKLKRQELLFKEYRRNSKKLKFDDVGKFVFVPLHYQPEATSYPANRTLADQVFMLKGLAERLQDYNLKVVVKEHSSIFSEILRGDRGRYLSFYREIQAIPNVLLVDDRCNSNELIDSSECVITVNGTASAEKAASGGKSVVFFEHWAAVFPTLKICRTLDECIEWVVADEFRSSTSDIPNVFDIDNNSDNSKIVKIIEELLT